MSVLRTKMITVALALAAGALVPAAASAGVVVSASGPSAASFPVGKKIGDAERITLRAGDTLTVLDGNGTRVLRGAGTYSLNQQAGTSRRSTFAVLTEQRSAQRMRTGAVRNAAEEGPKHAPNLWYVDVAKPGNVCLAGTERVRLWRDSMDGDATYSVSADGGGKETVTFADGEMLAPWDTSVLPVSSGAVYHVAGPGGAKVGDFRFTVLDKAAEEPEGLAEQLIEHGCTQQLELLSTAMLVAEG